MNYFLFTVNHINLYPPLGRYMKYLYGIELHMLSDATVTFTKDSVLLLFQDEKDHSELISIYESYSDVGLIDLGFSDDASVNLIDLSVLNAKLSEFLQLPPKNSENIFTHEELIRKVSQFFRTHGEESLLQGLINTIYFLQNGVRLFQGNGLSWQSAKEKFLKPGIDWWNVFTGRYKCYRYFFSLLNLHNEISEIEQLIIQLSEFIQAVGFLKPQIIKNIKLEEVDKSIKNLNTIYNRLENIADRLSIEIR